MIYDAGASSIRSTIVSFASVPSQTGKDATQVTVNGVGWADGVGGLSFDDRIRSILAEQFQGDVQGNDRAMAKLLKEANRVKTVLSANSDSLSRVCPFSFPQSARERELELFFFSSGPKADMAPVNVG